MLHTGAPRDTRRSDGRASIRMTEGTGSTRRQRGPKVTPSRRSVRHSVVGTRVNHNRRAAPRGQRIRTSASVTLLVHNFYRARTVRPDPDIFHVSGVGVRRGSLNRSRSLPSDF
jgi:hypothetical protein